MTSSSVSRPNIVYLHTHDAGRYIEPYGWPVRTPHLMAFAREGILFRKAFSAAPTCGPSRAAMLTGQYPHQCGMYGLPGGDGWALNDPTHHVVHTLNAAGYLTALAGVQHEVNHQDVSPLGYQCLLDEAPHAGEYYPGTLDRVEEFLTRSFAQPFFLSIGFDEPHRNNLARPAIGVGAESARFSKTRYYDPDRLDARYTAPLPWLPDLPEIRRDVASLHEGVRIFDEGVGRVLHMLKHRGLDANTLVIITTDHGLEFPHGKKTLSDQGCGVLWLMRGPDGFSGGKVIEPLVSQLDLYPTLMALLGLEPPPWLEGRDLCPLVRGDVDQVHEYVFTEQTYHGNAEPLRAVRSERYKLVLRHYDRGPLMRQDGPSTACLEACGHYDLATGHKALFDCYLDPMEACNRIADPALQDVRATLRKALDQWMQDTGDVFPSGAFPPKPCTRS